MSSTPGFDFSKFVPGFDFLQSLAQQTSQSSSAMPNLGHWVAPTINVEELEKRIEELKAVQFWLDQNSAALKATVQALEVQKMTLATLRGMNFSMGDLAEAFKIKTPVAEPPAPAPAPRSAGLGGMPDLSSAFEQMKKATDAASAKFGAAATAAPAPAPEPAPEPAEKVESKAESKATSETKKSSDAKAAGVVDPLQWWNALATQFQQIAASAVNDSAVQKAVGDTGHMAAKFAKEAMKGAEAFAQAATRPAAKKAPAAPAKKASTGTKPAAKSAVKASAGAARKTSVKVGAKTVKKSTTPAKKRAR